MRFIQSMDLSDHEWSSVHNLWNTEFPIQLKRSTLSDFKENIAGWDNVRHILAIDGTKVVGWFADFDRDDECWFALIVSSDYHGKGWGRRLLSNGQHKNEELNGWVISEPRYIRGDGKPYINPLPFYLKMGFATIPNVYLEKDGIKAIKIRWKK